MKKKSDLELTPDSFSRNSSLRELMAKAAMHKEAEALVIAALPASLASGSRFVCVNDGEVTISADTSAKASQIRFRQHEIMEKLRENKLFEFVWKLKVKVAPPRFREQASSTITPLSNENARLLKEVLEKLASHVRD